MYQLSPPISRRRNDHTNILLLTLLFIPDFVRCLKLYNLHVPARVLLGERAQLSCRWQLDPVDVLYSVKWYKDGKEFFRYVPKDQDPLRKFSLPGVEVAESDSSGANLTLASANLQTSGRYRCEVSGEKPFFPTVSKHADMQIIVLPDHGPVISGLLPRYRIGDKLSVNCTSGRSRPPTDLTWYINGERAYTNLPMNFMEYEDGLTVTSSTLESEVKETYFKGNRLSLKCLATLHPTYWKSKEENAVKDSGIAKRSEVTNIQTRIKFKSGNRHEINFAYSTRYNTSLYMIIIFWHFLNIISRYCLNTKVD